MKPKPTKITLEELKRQFYIDDNGDIRNLTDFGRKMRKGEIPGNIGVNQYRYIRFKGETRLAHHIAWALYYDEWPDHLIDHIDGNQHNNKKDNLRDGSMGLNARNQKMRNTNTSGINGYNIKKVTSPYMVRWYENGTRTSKCFKSIKEAELFLIEIKSRFGGGKIRYIGDIKRPHRIFWEECGSRQERQFETREEALSFKQYNDVRLQILYGYSERHGKAA